MARHATHIVISIFSAITIATSITSIIGNDATFNFIIPEWVINQGSITVAFERINLLFEVTFTAPTIRTYDNSYQSRVSLLNYQNGKLSFILNNISISDAGNYNCLSIKRDEIQDCGEVLIVLQKPKLPELERDGLSLVGNSLYLKCSSSSRSLPVKHNLTYIWKKNNNDIVNTSHIQMHDARLVIRKLSKSDGGDSYSCQAVEKTGLESDWSKPLVINVEYGPVKAEFDPNQDIINITEHNRIVSVRCSADCNPHCTVVWKDREKEETTITGQSVCILHINATNKDIHKQFTCEVYNKYNSTSRDLFVNVERVLKRETRSQDVMYTIPIIAAIVGAAIGIVAVTFTCGVLLGICKRKCAKTRSNSTWSESSIPMEERTQTVKGVSHYYLHPAQEDNCYETVE